MAFNNAKSLSDEQHIAPLEKSTYTCICYLTNEHFSGITSIKICEADCFAVKLLYRIFKCVLISLCRTQKLRIN